MAEVAGIELGRALVALHGTVNQSGGRRVCMIIYSGPGGGVDSKQQGSLFCSNRIYFCHLCSVTSLWSHRAPFGVTVHSYLVTQGLRTQPCVSTVCLVVLALGAVAVHSLCM